MAIGSFGPLDFLELNEGLTVELPVATAHGTSTTRGGGALFVTTDADISGTETSFLSRSFPSGFASSGGAAPSTSGLVLTADPGTPAVVTPDGAYEHFHATAIAEPIAPRSAVDTLELFALEAEAPNATFRVALMFAGGSPFAVFEQLGAGAQIVGSAPSSFGRVTLELIRAGGRVFAFANGAPIGRRQNAPEGPATLRLRTSSLASSARVVTRLFTLRLGSHALVNGRLLEGKETPFTRQLRGTFPAAEPLEIGPAEVTLFGPAGLVTATGFTPYIEPPQKTLGRGRFGEGGAYEGVLYTTQNSALRDPED